MRRTYRYVHVIHTSSTSSSKDFVVEDHAAGLLCSSTAASPTLPAAAAPHNPPARLASADSHTDTLHNIIGQLGCCFRKGSIQVRTEVQSMYRYKSGWVDASAMLLGRPKQSRWSQEWVWA